MRTVFLTVLALAVAAHGSAWTALPLAVWPDFIALALPGDWYS